VQYVVALGEVVGMTEGAYEVPQSQSQSMQWRLGAGWADWLWTVGGVELKVQASYVGPEVFAAFMNAVRDLLAGCKATFVTFFDEPSGTRIFFNQSDNKIFVQIVSFSNLNEPQTWWLDAKLLWAGRVSTEDFANAFMAMVGELLTQHGTAGYRKRWGHEFPATEWAALQAVYGASSPR
jgi:hypothetical protein